MLTELKKQYDNKMISNEIYNEKLFENYNILLEFGVLLKDSKCKKIEITEKGVVCHIRQHKKEIKMYINEQDRCAVPVQIIGYGGYEVNETKIVMDLAYYLDKESVFFDIGANLGWYALNILSQYPKFQCHMFEPVPVIYQRLCENVALNNHNVLLCNNFGFYNKDRRLDFHYDVSASGASSIANLRERDTTVKIQCSMKMMDNYMGEKGLDRLDFIKCDVEGSELFVYQGGIETIKKYKPIVFSEMLRKWSAKFSYHPNDIIALFSELGYQCFVISNQDKPLKRFSLVDENTVETNYFFLHEEKHKKIIQELVCQNNG